jgi:hypothetical protein
VKPQEHIPQQTIVDPDKVRPRLAPDREDIVWHHELVGMRLVEAAATVRRMPMRIWPKQFGTAWPSFAAMTSSELTAFQNELMQDGGQSALDAWRAEQNRVRIIPSGAEIERAEQALGWFVRYLRDDPETAKVVGHWANTTFDMDPDAIPDIVRPGLKVISRGLRRDRVPVRT